MIEKLKRIKELLIDIEINTNEDNPNYSTAGIIELAEATEILANSDKTESVLVKEYLRITSKSTFLEAAEKTGCIQTWINGVFKLIRKIDYSFGDLLEDRQKELRSKALFKFPSGNEMIEYSYENVYITAQEIAASFVNLASEKEWKEPSVAIFSENSPLSAITDIACLAFQIKVFPLNTSFDKETLLEIISKYSINIIVTDSQEKYELLEEMIKESGLDITVFVIRHDVKLNGENTYYLNEYIKRIDYAEIERILESKPRRPVNEVITVMFTSGSTGKPKGISFTDYNLVSKRFARAAALPFIGKDEVMLSYLPLFHTFGRYLEMMGSIFWRGTYVFTGSKSRSRLFKLFPKVEPTVFISIPLRWKQIFEEVEAATSLPDSTYPGKKLEEITGKRLKWGLSAAGYLAPEVFRFFNKYGVKLCSGFGMTEATGGITMTLPGEYIENSVGKPLPGIQTKLGEFDELFIKGEYVTRYAHEKTAGETVDYDEDYWLPTGDVFKINDDGEHFIIDRVKDIYKNNRGQTVSPKNVEDRFTGIPGFKRTFLVGDGKAYNSLFIVPDPEDKAMAEEIAKPESDYIKRMITEVNKQLANYERVVNYEVLERDFSTDKGELTPKGSYKRKQIVENFNDVIAKMYQSDVKSYQVGDLNIKLPRWFFRDLAILETDIESSNDELYDKVRKIKLKISRLEGDKVIIGDLVYKIEGDSLDLGIMAKSPYLWCGNPTFMEFAPCREGWDASTNNISIHVSLPEKVNVVLQKPVLNSITNSSLKEICNLLITSIFSGKESDSLLALREVRKIFRHSDEKIRKLIRLRFETIAFHDNEELRCEAYKALLLEEPVPETESHYYAFIESGKSFLNERSIKEIAESKLEKRRLESLRKRMHHYRKSLTWPAPDVVRHQFESVMRLLSEFALNNPQYYSSIRHEFSNWILHEQDPMLSGFAAKLLRRMSSVYEEEISEKDSLHKKAIDLSVFDTDITGDEKSKILNALAAPGFLNQSLILSHDLDDFTIDKISDKGIWISKLRPIYDALRYRVSIKLKSGMVMNLQLFINESTDLHNLETSFYHTSIAGFPFGRKSLPRLGTFRTEMNAKTMSFIDGLTLWEKIREINSRRIAGSRVYSKEDLERYFIEAMAAFWRCWSYSGERIVPGFISPENVIVPELDFREGATVLSIHGWKKAYEPAALIGGFVSEFYGRTLHHYPRFKDTLDYEWIFSSYGEVFGEEKLNELLEDIIDTGARSTYSQDRKLVLSEAKKFKTKNEGSFFLPLPLKNAIRRFNTWIANNPKAGLEAKENSIVEISRLYNLDRYPGFIKFYFFRHTIFSSASKKVISKFDKLLTKMLSDKSRKPLEFKEVQELHSTITGKSERHLFSRLIYPESSAGKSPELVVSTGEDQERLIIKSFIKDRYGDIFSMRRPVNPKEVGQLYRLFFIEKFPLEISDDDSIYIVLDGEDRVIGGITYKYNEKESVYMEGAVVTSSYSSRNLGKAMVNDFCSRMASEGYKYVKGGYAGKDFYLHTGFSEDSISGLPVRNLAEGEKIDIQGSYCIVD